MAPKDTLCLIIKHMDGMMDYHMDGGKLTKSNFVSSYHLVSSDYLIFLKLKEAHKWHKGPLEQ